MNKQIWGILLFIIVVNFIQAQNPLSVYCIDVDQGSSTLIASPENKYMLIDGGDYYSSSYNYGDTVLCLLESLGITHLDYTLATHYHQDHIGGMPKIIHGLSNNNTNDSILYYCYDRGDTYASGSFTYYRNAVLGKRRTINIGETIDLGGSAFIFCVVKNCQTLFGDTVFPSDENDRSIGLVLVYGSFRLNIDGDLCGYDNGGYRDLETKIAPIVGKVEVLICNHHGSRYSTNNVFLDSLRPQAAIFSQGTTPYNYGFPKQDVIDRLVSHNTYMYQMNSNSTGGTIPSGRGRILNTTAVITVHNTYYTINGDSYTLNSTGVKQEHPGNIPFSLGKFRSATVRLYNISGQMLNTRIISNPSNKNILQQQNDWYRNLASGIYFLHITATPLNLTSPLFIATKKVIVLPHR